MNAYNFTVYKQWCDFLKQVGLVESKMPPEQYREMKRAFYGAWGQCLLHARDEVVAYSENEAVKIMEGQVKEVTDFWLGETGRQN